LRRRVPGTVPLAQLALLAEGVRAGVGGLLADPLGVGAAMDGINFGLPEGVLPAQPRAPPGALLNGPFTPVAERIAALADLQQARAALGPLPSGQGARFQADGGVLASLEIGWNPRVYGANSVAERSLGVSANYKPVSGSRLVFSNGARSPTLAHAEGNAFAPCVIA